MVLKDCLDRGTECDKGLIIASADGMPLSAINPAKLLATVAELAAIGRPAIAATREASTSVPHAAATSSVTATGRRRSS